MPLYDRTLEHVAETLKQGKDRGIQCCLLVGAGCSQSAGIPVASEFVIQACKQYPQSCQKADPKSYAQCMAALSNGERYELLRKPIEDAKVNPAHLAIAQLVESGYVDRVLTTNFDPLVAKACALIHTPIATYDFAAAQTFNPGDTQPAAIFHLHGQHTGFRLLNTDEECNSLREAIKPLFDDSGKRRIWIVVGYSGDQDPVFEQLARTERFDHRLYWVVYKDAPPPFHVRTRLLLPEKYAFYVQGHDADGFFTKLAEALGCYPPKFMSQPFSHLEKLFATVQPHSDSSFDVDRLTASKMISQAKKKYETPENQYVFRLQSRLLLGEEDKLVNELEVKSNAGVLTEEERDVLAWAYIGQGTTLAGLARLKDGDTREQLFRDACFKCEKAIEIKPDKHEALYNWGIALDDLAQLMEGEAREQFFRDACAKYEQAIQIAPDDHDVWNNWGSALDGLAQMMDGDAREQFFRDACAKYEMAIQLRPDDPDMFCNWGIALTGVARMKERDAREQLFRDACAKYEMAIQLRSDDPDMFCNWGNALAGLARVKEGDAREQLFRNACSKYATAIQFKSDHSVAIDNLGGALLALSQVVKSAERKKMLDEARTALEKGESIKPGSCAYHLACLAALEKDNDKCGKWFETCRQHGTLPSVEHLKQDEDLQYVRRRKWFRDLLSELEARAKA